ncbi:unnamed protein product [Rotaria socialis]|uniref:NAD(P)(+)--arginine ADP-ribosyltransferase n=1 Tax=Rotaria socialis TaxID=392032 RepID=A0A818NKV8_9BILA|nr:unnamed protein product [Rotaria socialis]CAF3605427.1 unnamed protein product [Rotaria socialis]CAF4623680.1 unnamed protein product [Rotaria socialis]CAF4874967.1 unnamed protein product [Rotaria socialis]
MHGTSDSLNDSILPQDENQTTGFWNRLVQIGNSWKTFPYPPGLKKDNSESTSPSTSTKEPEKTLEETLGESLKRKIYGAEDLDLHDILRSIGKITWSERQLLIDKNEKILEITKSFHKPFENITEFSSIVDQVDVIKEFCSHFPIKDELNKTFEKYLENARLYNDPKYIIKAYTCHNEFTKRLNAHLATNAYHSIKLYCTILNCPALHLTKDYVDAFTYIIFHPKLKEYRVKNEKVYRGTVLDDEKLIKELQPGEIILTTTYLSTTRDSEVAEIFCAVDSNNSKKISVFCTYALHNTSRCSALDISKLSHFDTEEEILLLRYVPFKIVSVKRAEQDGRIDIYFEEYAENVLDPNQSESNNHNSIPMHNIQPGFGRLSSADIQDELNDSCL